MGDVMFGLAASKLPSPIFLAIFVVAIQAGYDMVLSAGEGKRSIPFVDKSRPVAGFEWPPSMGHLAAGEFELAVFLSVAVPALNRVQSLELTTIEIEILIVFIIVSILSMIVL